MDDTKSFMTTEVENLQKNSFIDPIREAKGFAEGHSESKIGKGIGKTQQYVSARLGLLRLEPEIQALITSRLVTAEHGYELSKIEETKKRTILAQLSKRDSEDSLSLNELREMAKLTIEELSKDPRVDTILLQDPAERIRRIETRVMKLENEQAHLASNGTWKQTGRLGAELVALHLQEDKYPWASRIVTKGQSPFKSFDGFVANAEPMISEGYPKHEDDKAYINPSCWFEGMPKVVWDFHIGGYQVCEKWLKDRRGRRPSGDNILWYRRIIVSLKNSILLMGKIDSVMKNSNSSLY